jgi:hypothetical protein
MPLFVLGRPVRRAQGFRHCGVRDCIGAENLHKFIVDRFGGKSFPVEIETNRALINCAVP